MKKKIVIALLLFFVVAFSSFAEMGAYLKGTFGSGFRTRDWGVITTTDSATGDVTSTESLGDVFAAMNVLLVPAFGITPWADSENAFLKGLAFELSVDVGWGYAYGIGAGSLANESYFDIYGVTPTIMVLYGYRFSKLMPYCGIGVSLPILFSWDFDDSTYNGTTTGYVTETDMVKIGWNINVAAGLGYALTETVMPVIEVGYGWGYNCGMGLSVRFGVVYSLTNKKSSLPPQQNEDSTVQEVEDVQDA